MYNVLIPRSVQTQLDKLPPSVSEIIIEKLLLLRKEPRPAGAIKLHGRDGYRIRSGEYRIIYDIDDHEKKVVVRRVGHRREIYRE